MPCDATAGFIYKFAADSFTDFEKEAASPEPDARAFLPVPDLSNAGRPSWILPNLSSFTTLYARINLFCARNLKGVRIIHDEQLQYDRILNEGKSASEGFAEQGRTWPLRHADYRFTESAYLEFSSSSAAPGIQAADLLAGFVMRYVQKINAGATVPSSKEIGIFESLQEMAEPERGTGFNFVIARRDFARLGLSST